MTVSLERAAGLRRAARINDDRSCHACGQVFRLGTPGAGTKYCSPGCKAVGYRGHATGGGAVPTVEYSPPLYPCSWCGATTSHRSRPNKWGYVCASCIEPIKHVMTRLKNHNVPADRARLLASSPHCEVCGVDILEKNRRHDGVTTSLLVVDHDHSCCPTESFSCGQCVRGLICRHCNSAAGFVGDQYERAYRLAQYLFNHQAKRESARENAEK
jgi:hypothetical protein